MTLISHYNYPGGEALAQFHASVAGTDTGAAVDQQNGAELSFALIHFLQALLVLTILAIAVACSTPFM